LKPIGLDNITKTLIINNIVES